MKAQRFRHIGQAHGQQSLRAQAEESGLTVHNGLGAPQKGALPLVHRPQNPLGLLELLLQVVFDLRVLRLRQQPAVVGVDPEGGAAWLSGPGGVPPVLLAHKDVRQDIGNLIGAFKDRTRPGVQLPDDIPGLLHLIYGEIHF